jgi:ubiquinone/menaquinone biosynthesis C-methylase UbiE
MKKMDDGLLKKFNEIETIHWWWEGRRELLRLLLKGKRPSRILDVGCGTGETLSFIHGLFPKAKLYGVDTSTTAIKFSKSRGHKKIYKSPGARLPFKKDYFDVILFLDVLEHIKNDQAVIEEAKRVLKKGGCIIITSPGLNFIWSRHDTEQGHKRRYTRTEIKRLASGSLLKTDFISYFNFIFSPPIITIRLLSRLKPFRSFADYDRGINFDIAKVGFLNNMMKFIFVNEVKALRYVRYPLGISIGAKLIKTI